MSIMSIKMTKPTMGITALVAVVTSLMLMLMAGPVVAQETHWVDPDSAAAAPGTGCGTAAGYATIQAAVNAAVPGDEVRVCAGTYEEDVRILNGTDDLTILGEGIGETILDGGIRTASNGFTLSGMTINGGGDWGDSGNDFPAVWLEGGTSGHTISTLQLVGPGTDPLTRRGLLFGIGVTNVTVTDVETTNWLSGVFINPSSALQFNGLHAHGNFAGVGSDGISDIAITESRFEDNSEGFGSSNVGDDVLVRFSSFTGNDVGVAHYSGETLDARCNYWGHAQGPEHPGGDDISGDVEFDRWMRADNHGQRVSCQNWLDRQ